LKKSLLSSRHRRTLASFGAFLKCTARWMEISQYGHNDLVRGEPKKDDRVRAKEYFSRDLFSVVPRSWTSCTNEDTESINHQWIYLCRYSDKLDDDVGSLREMVFSSSGSTAKRFCSGQYTSLDDAQNLRNKYCLVTYRSTADWRVPPQQGPWCTCNIWNSRQICPHTVCTAVTMGLDNSEEAIRQWSTIGVAFGKPWQRRTVRGKITSQSMPSTVKYGLQKRKEARGESSAPKRKKSVIEEKKLNEDE
ncbi:hypothetical protein FOL47_003510, partial [Perkinsus chesapeaki]